MTVYDGATWDHIMIRNDWQVNFEVRNILPKASRIRIDVIKDGKEISYIICWNEG